MALDNEDRETLEVGGEAVGGDGGSGEVAALDPRTARLLASAAAPRPLPPALRARLLALPGGAEEEEALMRRFERARSAGLVAAESGVPPSLPAELPRAQARSERAIAGWVAAARRPAALPANLRQRLLAIGRGARRPLPFWLQDVRWAAIACLVLTFLSTVLVGDASALLGERAGEVRAQREEWQERFAEVAYSRGEDTVAALLRTWHRSQEYLASRAEVARDLFEEKLRQFNQTELGRRLAGEP